MAADGALGFDLTVDAINIDAYMAPADESVHAAKSAVIPQRVLLACHAAGDVGR